MRRTQLITTLFIKGQDERQSGHPEKVDTEQLIAATVKAPTGLQLPVGFIERPTACAIHT
jgi:hypothetical protein